MNEKDFEGTIAGEVRWAMNGAYCYFHPHELPLKADIDRRTHLALSKAAIELARLDGMTSQMDAEESEILLTAFTLMESASSSSIEGTRSTLDDLFRSERFEEKDAERARDNGEVMSYKKALIEGFEALRGGEKISIELIKRLHRTLMSNDRGSTLSPGEFKTTQNAIGTAGDTLETAKMVPACPESVERLMENWIEYVNSTDVETIEKAAISHCQFESIHPFRDGNGRMGRLLIVLIIYSDGLLRSPVLYPSDYFNRHREKYIDGLFDVASKDAFAEWLCFFAEAVRIQAMSSMKTIGRLKSYRKMLTEDESNLNIVRAVGLLFKNPYVRSTDVRDALGLSLTTANFILGELHSRGVIREVSGKSRNRVYVADRIMEILRG
ncbi:MAG: Fic family protein [Methanomassiliicoccaceae archaeon]|nr:Fic family protein [Methanomassiliicoccaceae archaeon]